MEEKYFDKPFELKTWKKLWPFVAAYKKHLLFIALTMGASAAIDVLIPIVQKDAVTRFILSNSTEGLWVYGVLYLLGLVVTQVLAVILFARLAIHVEMSLGRDVRRALFVKLQTLGMPYYSTTPAGYILARAMNDTLRLGLTVAWGTVDILWALFYVVGACAAMLAIDWKLGLMIMVLIPLLCAATVYFQKRILTANRQVRHENSVMTGAYNEGIAGARTAKTLCIEKETAQAFTAITGRMERASVKAALLNAIFVPIVAFCSSIAVSLVLYYGGALTLEGFMDLSVFSLFISYGVGLFEPVQQFARNAADFISVQACVERITDVLDTEPTVADSPETEARCGTVFDPKPENYPKIQGDVEFRHVSFGYGKGDVLEDFSLKVPKGASVAIVGETGAGKSTLVNLLCRFYEPDSGQILIDGQDYRALGQSCLHANLGYVLQDPHLFSGTIEENIRYGKPDATDEEVRQAAELVCAHKVAQRLPGGYKAHVGEGGDRLSTGEKQLISFARAVLRKPPLIVLDEATSSIDTATEQLIQEGIAGLLKGRTAFVVAHRLSTVKNCDCIVVLDRGKILEMGSHQALMAKKGRYYALYTRRLEL